MPRARLLLASASPARRSTLIAAGIDPMIAVSEVDEDATVDQARRRHGDLSPADVALLLARAKAEAVHTAYLDGDVVGDADLILGCDSVLELDGEVHGKPADATEAVARWSRMSGRSGVLHTGHWLLDAREPEAGGTGGMTGATASTQVHFARLSPHEIEAYVATGEPLRVAGAFTIDGLGGAFVTRIEGDHHNVVGLSLPLLRELLGELGLGWFDLLD
ncbi:MAG: septum formation inhibitor Maf [Tetrasphaera sp.]|nr:septum formation inhibitor Maf [Tetrasphaera sp.]